MKAKKILSSNAFKTTGIAALAALGGMLLTAKTVNFVSDRIINHFITQKLEKNLWELAESTQRLTPNNLVETELRAETDTFIERPIGGPRRFKYTEKVLFNIAQLHTLPTVRETAIDTSVVIGPRAQRPLKIDIPILVAGMSYGLAVTEAFKLAWAKGANLAGTATNTGLGPWMESERKTAHRLILQYSRTSWNKDENIIKRSDAIEIQFGQGANAGVGKTLKSKDIDETMRKRLGLEKGQDAVTHNRIEGIEAGPDLKRLISRLKLITGGVPVGVKIGAGKFLEEDLKIIVAAGADFVSIDGAEAGTHGSLPILEDDFGLPTFIAACRAGKFWERHNLKGKISLLVGGALATPGECLKMLALGADAVYMGTAILIATTHTQVLKTSPFAPPTQLAYQSGKYKNQFNIDEGAKSCANFLNATAYEIKEAVKALGKLSVGDVNKEDIFSVDREVAEIAGIELCFASGGS